MALHPRTGNPRPVACPPALRSAPVPSRRRPGCCGGREEDGGEGEWIETGELPSLLSFFLFSSNPVSFKSLHAFAASQSNCEIRLIRWARAQNREQHKSLLSDNSHRPPPCAPVLGSVGGILVGDVGDLPPTGPHPVRRSGHRHCGRR